MLIHAKVLLPKGDNVQGKIKDNDGNIVGTFDYNPILDSIIYDVEVPDGADKKYAANVIDENM